MVKKSTAIPLSELPATISGSPIEFFQSGQDSSVSHDPVLVETDVASPEEIEGFGAKIEVPWIPSRVTPENFLSTGITTLNLSLTNTVDCGLEKGTMTWLIGSSSGGKTIVALQLCAEVANNPHFDDYDILYCDAEGGAQFDIRGLFGSKTANRLKFETMKNGEPFRTVEDFYGYAHQRAEKNKPFFMVLDSMDVLGSTPEAERFAKNIAEREKNLETGKESASISPGFGDGKAKINSAGLRRLRNRLPVNGSMFVCISQERTDITTGQKTVSGGAAIKFFSDTALWLTQGKDIVKTWEGKDRSYGQYSSFAIKKNRTSGMKVKIEFPILLGTGISDVDGCIDWMKEESEAFDQKKMDKEGKDYALWKIPAVPSTQSWEGFFPDGSKFKLTRPALVKYFEDNPEVLKEVMRRRWRQILNAIIPVRRKRYS